MSEIPSELLARTHLAKAEQFWLEDRLEQAHAALALAMNAGLFSPYVFNLQRMVDAELLARRDGRLIRAEEHLALEIPASLVFGERQLLQDAVTNAWRDATAILSVRWGKPVLITFFTRHEASLFVRARYGYYTDRVGHHKICFPHARAARPRWLRSAVLHEVSHAALHDAAGDRVPRWFDEGVAVWMDSYGDTDNPDVRFRSFHGRRMSLFELSATLNDPSRDLDEEEVGAAYDLAGSFVASLVARHGVRVLVEIARCLGAGQSIESAFRSVANETLSRSERSWLDTLA